jgi:hypothetical protein
MIGRYIMLIGELTCSSLRHWLMQYTRFVDRDMLVRYHWGLGVGHSYAHGTVKLSRPQDATEQDRISDDEFEDNSYVVSNDEGEGDESASDDEGDESNSEESSGMESGEE